MIGGTESKETSCRRDGQHKNVINKQTDRQTNQYLQPLDTVFVWKRLLGWPQVSIYTSDLESESYDHGTNFICSTDSDGMALGRTPSQVSFIKSL